MKATIDPRVQSAESLLTGQRLLEGHGSGLIRPHDIARLVGCSIWNRIDLLDWIEAKQLWHEAPYAGPLVDRPEAGTIDIARLRKALRKGLASTEGLPFPHTLVASDG